MAEQPDIPRRIVLVLAVLIVVVVFCLCCSLLVVLGYRYGDQIMQALGMQL